MHIKIIKIHLNLFLGITVCIQKELPWAVLIVSSIMRRAHDLLSSKELIFIDTTASCDTLQTNITQVLTVTKAGAVQLATLLHGEATAEAYAVAFRLLLITFPNCFGGTGVIIILYCYLLLLVVAI